MITEITAQDYEQLDQAPKMIEFYSKTCGPCKMLSYVLKDIDKMKPDFLPQATEWYQEPSGLVWDIRQKKWMVPYRLLWNNVNYGQMKASDHLSFFPNKVEK